MARAIVSPEVERARMVELHLRRRGIVDPRVLRAFERQREPAFLWAAGAGAVAANLVLQLHCPVTARGHLLLGHFGVALIALLAALLLGARRAKR